MSISELMLSLLNHLTLLVVTCTFLFGALAPVLNPLKGYRRDIVEGLLLGSVALVVMLNPFRVVMEKAVSY